MLQLLGLVLLARADVVINEIYYDPPDRTEQSEFIELHNTGTAGVNLAGWRFSDGVEFVFGPEAIISAEGYLVVARNPTACRTRFGVTALGPWIGSLSKSGETVELRDAAGRVIDQVDYQAGFPWPTSPKGAGASMELINPALDNSLGGSWRGSRAGGASPSVVYVPPGSSQWRFRKGTSEASSPVDAWRKMDFVEDGTWATGQTSIGYGDADDATELADMLNNYTSLFLRHSFTATAATMPTQLVVRVRVDDGCVIWLNGVEVGRLHVAAGTPAFNGVGQDHEATATPEEILIPNAKSLLRAGTNILAVQAFNSSLASSDVTIDVELRAPDVAATAGTPTPGRRNSVFATNGPPAIRQVRHLPEQPKSGESVVLSALVTAPGGVKEVTGLYQIVEPGAYLRKTAPAYETNWIAVVMHDDGANGDLVAGDGVFSATLPATMQTHRRLVRYRLRAVGANDVSVTVPYADDESPNFAYFVYDGAPAWRGANRPGVAGGEGVVKEFPASLMTNLPAYHLLANETDVLNSQYNSGYDGVRMWGTLVYDGQVYDHIRFNNRGEASTYVSGKNKWRFHFNRARDFEPRDRWGHKYKETWGALNLNGCSSPWSAVNRGMSGLDEALSFRVYELLGVPSPRTHHVHFRVVDRAAETASASQYESDLWGLYLAIEQPDGGFLDERGLPDGNVYKIEGGGGDKKHQGATQPVSATDWNQFASASGGTQTETWWRANMDVNAYYSFHAGNRVVGNVDLREGWNHYFYHRADGRWVPVPWDLDMQFAAKTHWSGTIVQKNVLNVANLRLEFKNRSREILDLLLSDPAPDGGQIGQLIDEYSRFIYTADNPLNWVELDKCMWNWNPRTPGNGAPNGQTNHKGNFFRTPFSDERIGGAWTRTLASPDFPGSMRFILEYCTDTYTGATWAPNNGNQKGYGYRFVAYDAADTLIPDQPVITYLGPANYPADQLRFGVSAFNDPQGSNTFGAIQWRLAEIIAPGMATYASDQPRRYEIEATWTSGEIPRFEPETRVPDGVAGAGRTYRARCRMKDNTGRWSHWSRPVQFVAGAPDVTRWQRDLQLTEIMYNPPVASATELATGYGNDDFEYLELANVGTEALDLTNVRVVQGVDATFPAGTQLAPGGFAVLARNPVAFALRYGTNIPVAASFAGDNLRNEGETIRIVFGDHTTLINVAYGTKTPWPESANGQGASLELVAPETRPDPANPLNWRASGVAGGSPGRAGGMTYAAWAAGRPALADPRADADGDLTPNWIEYALGTDPLVANPAPALKVEWRVVGGNPAEPQVRLQRRAALEDVVVALEFSRDLVTWNLTGERAQTLTNPDGTIIEWWRVAGKAGDTGARFARLRITPLF